MSTGTQMRVANREWRRRVTRFAWKAPLEITVLRSGIPDTIPGRSVDVCECGLGAILPTELKAGEIVGLELHPPNEIPLRTRARIRHHENLRYGMEFVGISPEKQRLIRDWTQQSESHENSGDDRQVEAKGKHGGGSDAQSNLPEQPSRPSSGGNRRLKKWFVLLVLAAALTLSGWWQWNRGWRSLETGLHSFGSPNVDQAEVQVPGDVMQKLVLHRVEPEYPEQARRAKLEGTIALDVTVGRDGSVLKATALNGPDSLARSATDAMRWWKFQPYRVNGQPVVVETTFAMEFKP